jgi:hypothetical protein
MPVVTGASTVSKGSPPDAVVGDSLLLDLFRKKPRLIMSGCPHFIELGGTSVSG